MALQHDTDRDLRAAYCRYDLIFKEPATTSRETMTTKETYFIKLWHKSAPNAVGIGECALFRGLSADDCPEYETVLRDLCATINRGESISLPQMSSIRFGFMTALGSLCNYRSYGPFTPFPTLWSREGTGIEINGLVWMGSIDEMRRRIDLKLAQGFRCIKMKIGGQNFDEELEMVRAVRSRYPSAEELEIRLDANGAFSPDNALDKLAKLAACQIHSIEQPIKAGQWSEMARICRTSPIPVALDEELIGVESPDKEALLTMIRPAYIILKPSLCGGFTGADEWRCLAQSLGIGWWATSALESNVGLNAIAQWVSRFWPSMPQGLGTGSLYVNNIPSPLRQTGSTLRYDSAGKWEMPDMPWIEP